VMQGSTTPVLADVTDARNPKPICTITGSWSPQLVTQTMISWSATQGSPGTAGESVVAVLDLYTGTSTVVATWTGGGFLDGLHAWSPDRGFLAYLTSDANAVNLHLLSGGGDRVVASMGPVPGRGVNPSEDDAYLGFSPDGAYFALVQSYTASGDHLQIRHTTDGSLAYSQASGTMATWGSSGSHLYFRKPLGTVVSLWDSSGGVSQAFGQQLAWIRPRATPAMTISPSRCETTRARHTSGCMGTVGAPAASCPTSARRRFGSTRSPLSTSRRRRAGTTAVQARRPNRMARLSPMT